MAQCKSRIRYVGASCAFWNINIGNTMEADMKKVIIFQILLLTLPVAIFSADYYQIKTKQGEPYAVVIVTVGDNIPVLVGENFPVSCP